MSFSGGYFSSLTDKISVTSNSTWITDETCGGSTLHRTDPISILQGNPANIYHSKQYQIANIIIDMKRKFTLTGFALRGNTGCCYLKSYSFKGSNNNETWVSLKDNNNEDLKSNYNWHNYTVPKSKYRYYGIFQDPDASKADCGSNYYFSLSGLDFISPNNNKWQGKGTCKRFSMFKAHVFIYIFITK